MKLAPPSERRDHRTLAIAGVIVLALVTGGLAIASLTQPRWAPSPDAHHPPTVAPETPAKPDPEPSPEEPESPATAVAPQRLVIASGTGALLRTSIGACPGEPAIAEASADGGATWVPAHTDAVGATRVLGLSSGPDGMLRMSTLDAACAPQAIRSFIGGTSWEVAGELGASWFVDLSDANLAQTSIGPSQLPCAAVSVVGQGDQGVALCADTGVTVSVDGGASWSAPVVVPGAAAVGVGLTNADAPAVIVASHGEPACAGVRTRVLGEGVLGEPGACLAADVAGGGDIAVTGDGADLVVWAGSTFARSSDGGHSWQ